MARWRSPEMMPATCAYCSKVSEIHSSIYDAFNVRAAMESGDLSENLSLFVLSLSLFPFVSFPLSFHIFFVRLCHSLLFRYTYARDFVADHRSTHNIPSPKAYTELGDFDIAPS